MPRNHFKIGFISSVFNKYPCLHVQAVVTLSFIKKAGHIMPTEQGFVLTDWHKIPKNIV
jgi:hypothetical protein